MTPDEIITALDMRQHPEGGHYVETWRGRESSDGRAIGTAIYYLLRSGERSHWHRVDADELWLFHAGAALVLSIADAHDPEPIEHRLGVDLAAGERPQACVPAHAWQSATTSGAWTLVSCTVTPGFEFGGFELASPDWSPDRG